ncbi:acyl- thioesterase ii [Vairimorpha apis BRL 01]|nr:acyl- thioesterase ii [Vairimorpha apis BRL 01]
MKYIDLHFEENNELRKKQIEFIKENLGVLNNSFYIEVGEFRDNTRQIKITFLNDLKDNNQFSMFVTLLSDLLVVESALLSLNLKLFSKELHKISSIDHNLYFVSCELPKDKTIYYILECSSVKESKANIMGKICTSDGKLICTTSQQALVRLKK